jgi:phospholipid/cholesterol/gamma-HCH transport system substrate-binding protein
MIRTIRKHLKDFLAIIGLGVIATAVGLYILNNQRLRLPFIEPTAFKLKAQFETAQAVIPGQGQTVRVSGVRIGDIGKVELRRDGRAVITMEIDDKYKRLVRTDGTAYLRPKTGLKDMFIELHPGSKQAPVAKAGYVVPIHNTLPDVNPDEFFAALDSDTRDYLKLLLNGAARGLRGRGNDLAEVLARFEPTNRDLAAVSTEVAKRRVELRRLINSLNRLNQELKTKDDDLAQLIESSSRVFRAFASQSGNVQATLREFPSALRQTTSTLGRVDTMARLLGPTSDRLVPVARALDRANRQTIPFALEAAPRLERDIRPFVRTARPVVRNLNPAARDLVKAEPFLTRSFVALNHLFNLLGYNKNGREGPGSETRDEGYLFYLAWLGHQTTVLFQNGDAHGPGRPITVGGLCGVLKATAQSNPQAVFILGLAGALTNPQVCGGGQP